jgi:hypothetical protein
VVPTPDVKRKKPKNNNFLYGNQSQQGLVTAQFDLSAIFWPVNLLHPVSTIQFRRLHPNFQHVFGFGSHVDVRLQQSKTEHLTSEGNNIEALRSYKNGSR